MIIGRTEEQVKLKKLYQSNEAEFIAIYGRRRVGKTFLIKELFSKEKCYFLKVTGEKDASLKSQLENFSKVVSQTFYPKGIEIEAAKSWKKAFEQLTTTIKAVCGNKKVVLFFDELPWLAGNKSKILTALEFFWNDQWADMNNLKLIVCGSAASWMIRYIIENKGGLHNRLTYKIRLSPFNLNETKEYLKTKGIKLSSEQALEVYLLFGGIPFYLKLFQKNLSISQNINALCFTNEGILFKEFHELYSSLFKKSEAYEEIVAVLNQAPEGMTKAKLVKQLRLSSDGGGFNNKIRALKEAGFIKTKNTYKPGSKKDRLTLVDEYTIFYFKWIQPKENIINDLGQLDHYWENISKESSFNAWRGLSFERYCFKHLAQLTKALHIQSINKIGPWSYIPKPAESEKGAQIDLMISRDDGAITLCEIKYTDKPFSINKKYAEELNHKMNVFREKTKTKKQIIFAMISVNGIKENIYSKELIAWDITLEDLIAAS